MRQGPARPPLQIAHRFLAAALALAGIAALAGQSPAVSAQQQPAHECTAFDSASNTIVNSCGERVRYEGLRFFAGNCRTTSGHIDAGGALADHSEGRVCVQYSDADTQRDSGYAACPSPATFSSRVCRETMQIHPAEPLPALKLSSVSLTVREGSSRSFSVALTTQPAEQVKVTLVQPAANTDVTVDADLNADGNQTELIFTTSDWGRARSVTVSAAGDEDGADGRATVSLTASGGDYDGLTAGVSVTVSDDDPRGLILAPERLAVDEGDAADFTVRLATRPTGSVTVTLTQPGNIDVTVDADGSAVGNQIELTFTDADWSTAKSVAVNVAEDADAADERASIGLSAAGADYDGVSGSVAVDVADVDIGLSLSTTSLRVDEGGSGTFTVALRTLPSAPVTVTLSQGGTANGDVSFDPSSLNFTSSDWSAPQTVTVRAADDADQDDERASISLAAAGGDYAGVSGSVAVDLADDDIGLSLSATSLSLDEGGSAEVTIRLKGRPSSTVTVRLTQPSNTDITVDSDSGSGGNQTRMLFTVSNWERAQTFSVRAAEDEDSVDDVATVSLSASGGGYDSIRAELEVMVDDDDSPGLILAPAALAVDEGGSASFEVALAAPPSEAVTVALVQGGAAANADVSFAPSSLTFTDDNWDTARTVTVTAAEDADSAADGATISLSASGGDYAGVAASLAVTVSDDEAVGLTLSATSLSIEEGASATFTVQLAVAPGGVRTVRLSSDNDEVSLSPTSLSFAAGGDNQPQTVTVSAGQDDDREGDTATITLAGAGIATGVELAVTVADDDAQARPEQEREGALLQLAVIAGNLTSATGDIISLRFGAPRGERSATVDGQEIDLERALARDLAEGFAARAGVREAPQERFAEDGFGAERHSSDWLGGIALEDGRPLHSGAAAASDAPADASDRGALLEGFSYALSPDEAGGDGWSIWGRAGASGFSRTGAAGSSSGAEGDILFDGAQSSVWLGFDRRAEGGMLSGVAYASSSSDSDYRLGGFDAGIETDMSIVLPYIEISAEGGSSAHLMIGLVDGEATLSQTDGSEGGAALSMYLVVAGGSRPAVQLGNSTLSWTTDLNFSRLSTSESELAALRDISVSSLQFRGGVELAHSGIGQTWTAMPSIGLKLRHDSGDGVTGTGLELNADMRVLNSSSRFSLGFSVRMLTLHSADEFSDWSTGLQLRLSPGSGGEGLEFALGPTWGAGDDALPARDEALRLEGGDLPGRQMRRSNRGVAGSLGYGLRTLGGLLTPYSEYRLTSGGHGETRQVAGLRFAGGDGIDLRLFSERWILGRGGSRSRLAVELLRRF